MSLQMQKIHPTQKPETKHLHSLTVFLNVSDYFCHSLTLFVNVSDYLCQWHQKQFLSIHLSSSVKNFFVNTATEKDSSIKQRNTKTIKINPRFRFSFSFLHDWQLSLLLPFCPLSFPGFLTAPVTTPHGLLLFFYLSRFCSFCQHPARAS